MCQSVPIPTRKSISIMIPQPESHLPNHQGSERRGHAILLTLLILMLTAVVAFGVLSIGRRARVKEITQFSAQAGAESGAAWIARSLNTVAMNNSAMAQLIAQAGIIHAIPTAMDLYNKDLKAAEQLFKQIDPKDLPRDWQPIDEANLIAAGYAQLVKETGHELSISQNTLNYLRKQASETELATVTHVLPKADASDSGAIWQAINALDEINQTILENLEIQTQLSVLRGSILDTTARQTEASALLLPTSNPLVQWQRGSFDDFAPIVLHDHTYMAAMSHFEYTINPNVSILRDLLVQLPAKLKTYKNREGQCYISHLRANKPIRQDIRPKTSEEFNPSESGQMLTASAHDDALLATVGGLLFRLQNMRLIEHLNNISEKHLADLWSQKDAKPVVICDSQWITDQDKIYQIMDKEPQSIREIAYVTVQIKSLYDPSDPKFRSEGTWVMLDQPSGKALPIEYFTYHKKLDPRTWTAVGMQELHPRLWREVWPQQIHQDRTINLKALPPTPENKYPKQTIYRVDDYLLLGINVGKELKLDSPYNFPAGKERPAPVLYIPNDPDPKASDLIKRTVVAQNHVRTLPWSTPVAPTETNSPLLAPYDLQVSNMDNKTLWFQGWSGQAVEDELPNLAGTVPTNELEPLVSGKLYESVLTELKTRVEQAQKETEVP